MYLKVEKGSPIYSKLYKILTTESLRYINFKIWMLENLPEYNGNVLVHLSPFYIFGNIEAWKFVGEVDRNTWQPVKDHEGYYEPNKRTEAGKAMRKRISDAIGVRYNRFGFFDLFKTFAPRDCLEFTMPTGFVFDGVCYMMFDDANYKDISVMMAGQFTEITNGEWDNMTALFAKSHAAHFRELLKKHNEELN